MAIGVRGALLALVLSALAGGLRAGTAPFGEPQFRDIETEPAAVEAADLSGDGVPDLIVIQGTYTGNALCYEGKGDGTFPPEPTDSTRLYLHSNGAAVADFDGDGRPDIAATNGACRS